jgi:hypothetical protein
MGQPDNQQFTKRYEEGQRLSNTTKSFRKKMIVQYNHQVKLIFEVFFNSTLYFSFIHVS